MNRTKTRTLQLGASIRREVFYFQESVNISCAIPPARQPRWIFQSPKTGES